MSMDTKKQAGFGAVAIIVAVLVIAVLGFVGWRLYSSYSKPSANTTTSSNQAAHQTGNMQTNATGNTSTSDQATYLDIKELGVKIKLDDSIKDVVYSYSVANNSQYPQYVGGVNLSSQSLINKDSACKPENGANPLGSINELSTNQDGLGNTLVPNGSTVFKLGNNYYILNTPQSPCSNDSTVEALATQQRAVFAEDFKTVQLDN